MDRIHQISFAGSSGASSENVFFSACGTGKRNLCLNKCDTAHAVAVIPCNFKINTRKNKAKDRCFANAAQNRSSCKNNCPSADQDCIDIKNNPSGGSETTPVLDDSQSLSEDTSTGTGTGGASGSKTDNSDTVKKVLIYTGITVGAIVGLSLLTWGIVSAFKVTPKSS